MPGKNKQQKNAFYFYMQDLLVVLKKEGRVFPGGMAEVVPIAHPRFKMLSEKDKERYENMAKEAKKRMRGQPGDAIRQDNVGNIIAHRKDEVSEYEKEREKEMRDLMRHWPQDVTEQRFHFIDVQSLCKTKDGQYLPVEIAIIEFSLKDGIRKVYHEFLKPGQIPTGMRYECMSQSEDTHRIPVEGHPDASNNYLSVQNCIENFINPAKESPSYPPVFALREEWRKVDYTLEFIRHHSRLGQRAVTIRVFELESLLVGLVSHSGEGAPSKQAANDVLTSTTHDYHQGLKCKYHEELECKHCSLLWVRKFCYAIADGMKKIYDYEIKPRTHLPTMKGQQFSVAYEEIDNWQGSSPQKAPSNQRSTPTFKPPSNLPKTESVLARAGQPAPIFRPPGSPGFDFGKNKTRYQQQQGAWRAPTPDYSVPSTEISTPLPPSTPVEDVPTLPSRNTDLAHNREASWVPNAQSRGSWSRRTTPASTPRITPLTTPKHSPPREGAYFPPEFVRRHDIAPPPGLSVRYPKTQSSLTGMPPPGFGHINSPVTAAGDGMEAVGAGFGAMSVQSTGRGRGSALRM